MGSIARKRGGTLSAALPIVWICSVGLSPNVAADDGSAEAAPFRVRMRPNIEAARAVERALNGADQHLADPACLDVLTDFDDASARRFREALDSNDSSARPTSG